MGWLLGIGGGAAAKGISKALRGPKPPTMSPTPPPVQMQSVEQSQIKRRSKSNLRRTQSIFAGENKQTLG